MSLTQGENSYIEIQYADDFWADRGNPDWENATQPEKEQALVLATDAIDSSYVWPGRLEDNSQQLSWPRSGAEDKEGRPLDGIPKQVKKATAYLAAKQVGGAELFGESEQAKKRVKAGDVEVEWQDGSGPAGNYPSSYQFISNLLSPISINVVGNDGILDLSRA